MKPDRPPWHRDCSKTRYRDKREAVAALHRIIQQPPRNGHCRPNRAYLCPYCHGYHLTHRSESE